jgi:hypothetical protein
VPFQNKTESHFDAACEGAPFQKQSGFPRPAKSPFCRFDLSVNYFLIDLTKNLTSPAQISQVTKIKHKVWPENPVFYSTEII